ncbi:type I-E CRISPR-associated endoribonuclease Cas2e [Plantactinospora sp. KBS50]|uniref:type I-E CRISPR-associated endoribonuclease Cas2e n=1 Tax=Plantactinospora sp. KBS50 TaxID=2024580 RepID=UPI000BAAF217|nr:type I-E CRISPR-associated endoribonuclease Cas2e [Plantactinospora sp. KBS50]ASW55528.1 type I-E CRISPR-associated endoribonuclease Cas2 [Plantactinospora sp. KBS50]
MAVIVLTACPAGLRGHLTQWLIEISAGVYVGHVSTRVRRRLWSRVTELAGAGRAPMVLQVRGEQRLSGFPPAGPPGSGRLLVRERSAASRANPSRRRVQPCFPSSRWWLRRLAGPIGPVAAAPVGAAPVGAAPVGACRSAPRVGADGALLCCPGRGSMMPDRRPSTPRARGTKRANPGLVHRYRITPAGAGSGAAVVQGGRATGPCRPRRPSG